MARKSAPASIRLTTGLSPGLRRATALLYQFMMEPIACRLCGAWTDRRLWNSRASAKCTSTSSMPTPSRSELLERILTQCRHVYNAALGERREAWHKRGVSIGYYQQKAELPGIKEAMPEYADVHSQVLQDVVLRVDRAYQAFFRRIQDRRDTRLSPLPWPRPLHQLHLSAGRAWRSPRQRLSRPVQDRAHRRALVPSHRGRHPRRSRSAEKRMAGMSAAPVRDVPVHPLPPTWSGDRHRPWTGSLRHAFGWHAHLFFRLVSQGRTRAENGPTSGESSQEGQ